MLSNDRFFFVVHLLLPGRHSLALMLPGVNAKALGMMLVASSVRTRADHDSMVPYEGLLRILS